jgi:hypothetical protein
MTRTRLVRRAAAALPALSGAALLAFSLRSAPVVRGQSTAFVFPLRLQVARAAGDPAVPAVTDAWLSDQIAVANTLFTPHGVGFAAVERRPLADAHAELETRADRHALGALLDPTRIDVFVVRSLRDVDDPSQMRRGVHWRPAGRPGAHFVVVSMISGPSVLAHELGHYFGNPHSSTPGNLMSYQHGEGPPFLNAAQGRRILRAARSFARAGLPTPISRAASAELPPETR